MPAEAATAKSSVGKRTELLAKTRDLPSVVGVRRSLEPRRISRGLSAGDRDAVDGRLAGILRGEVELG